MNYTSVSPGLNENFGIISEENIIPYIKIIIIYKILIKC